MKIPLKICKKNTSSTTIASFDIGIKNLAFCIMYYDHARPSGSQFVIKSWQNLNLIPNGDPIPCVCLIKSGKKKGECCGKKAHWLSQQNEPLCRVHAKSGRPIEYRRTDSMSFLEINTELVKRLDQFPELLDCDQIVLEKQPTMGTNRVRMLPYMLYSYFVIRGMIDPESPRIKSVGFISPKNKLSIYDGPDIPCNLKRAYDRNKFLGTRHCEYLIRNDQPNLKLFREHRKKDDLADAFLQGAWYLLSRKKKLPPKPNMAHLHENNVIKYKEIKARRPTVRQVAKGRYTMNNLKWTVRQFDLNDEDRLLEFIKDNPNLGKTIEYFFGDISRFVHMN